MTDCKIQLERLKRHYFTSLNHYDKISFLDLAHSLRIWTELKSRIDIIVPEPIFKKAIITKTTKKVFSHSEFVYSYFLDGVTTSAAATKEINGRNVIYGPEINEFSVCTLLKIETNQDLTLAQFSLIKRELSEHEVYLLNDESKKTAIKKVNFSSYMNSPAAYFRFSGCCAKNISNEELIKRIANEYEASHADSEDTNFQPSNSFSLPVRELMKYGCACLPLPYFTLLHIAKNIIENLDGKLEEE